MPNQNPLKSQIAANRERFDVEELREYIDSHFKSIKKGMINLDREILVDHYLKAIKVSQTSLLQTAIAAVEEMKAYEGYEKTPDNMQMLHENRLYNSALSKVVELLKGGIGE